MGWWILSLELGTKNTVAILISAVLHITAYQFRDSNNICTGTFYKHREGKNYIINIE